MLLPMMLSRQMVSNTLRDTSARRRYYFIYLLKMAIKYEIAAASECHNSYITRYATLDIFDDDALAEFKCYYMKKLSIRRRISSTA